MVVYAVVLAIRGPMNPETVFPFARWELFSRVPLEVTTSVSVRLIEVDGVVLDPPLYFDESEEHVDQPRSAVAAALMEQLGAGLRDGDVAKAARAQAMSSSQGVASLSSSRLCHLPTAFGSQVTGMVPAWHLKVLPFCCQGEQGPMAWVSQSVTACWLASLR